MAIEQMHVDTAFVSGVEEGLNPSGARSQSYYQVTSGRQDVFGVQFYLWNKVWTRFPRPRSTPFAPLFSS
jgi:hypothetical protein